jgi:hypothetical protein
MLAHTFFLKIFLSQLIKPLSILFPVAHDSVFNVRSYKINLSLLQVCLLTTILMTGLPEYSTVSREVLGPT